MAVDTPTPSDELRQLLHDEVHRYMNHFEIGKLKIGRCHCDLCPRRSFSKQYYLRHHIVKYHTDGRNFSASGTKQLRLAQGTQFIMGSFDYV